MAQKNQLVEIVVVFFTTYYLEEPSGLDRQGLYDALKCSGEMPLRKGLVDKLAAHRDFLFRGVCHFGVLDVFIRSTMRMIGRPNNS